MSTTVEIPKNLVRPVRKVAAMDLIPGLNTNSYNSHVIVVGEPDNQRMVNHCSGDYQLIRNSAILNPILEGLSGMGQIEVKGLSWREAVFSMQVIVSKERHSDGRAVKDSLHPEIQILNSYNGRIKCSVRMGMYRVVCENGLSIPDEFTDWSAYSHTPMNEEELAVPRILEKFRKFLGISDNIARVYDDLKFMPVVNLTDRVDEVIEGTKFPAKLRDAVLDRITFERAQGFKSTDWLVFNGFNYQLNHHEELNWDPGKKIKTDQAILNFLLEN